MEVRDAGITEPCVWITRPGPPTASDRETEAQRGWEPQGGQRRRILRTLVASSSTEGPGCGKGRGEPLSRSHTRPSHTVRTRLPGSSAPSLPAPRAQSLPATDAGRSGEAAPAASWPRPCPRPATGWFTCTPPSIPARHFPRALRPPAPHFRLVSPGRAARREL